MYFDLNKAPRSKAAWEAGKEFLKGEGWVDIFDLAKYIHSSSDLQPSSIFSLLLNLEKEGVVVTRDRKRFIILLEDVK